MYRWQIFPLLIMTKINAKQLLKKHRLGTLTDHEKAILETWYNEQGQAEFDFSLSQDELDADLDDITQSLPPFKRSVKPLFIKHAKILAVAASVLFVCCIGIWYFMNNSRQEIIPNIVTSKVPEVKKIDVLPGEKKAILTLADNSQVILDNESSQQVAKQSGIVIHQTADGQLIYHFEDIHAKKNVPVQFNTISTPTGGEYKIQLVDGTVVWLNALSSLRFPTSFKGNERHVELIGEAYFEVAPNAKMPFKVTSNGQIVEVLGTHFNVSAYKEERQIKTTLLEGSVKVSTMNESLHKILKPGYQSILNAGRFSVQKVDIEEAVAWKNGYFIFLDEDLKSIMRKISRWYNVDVVYQNTDMNLKFGGAISRKRKLSEVLQLLEMTDNIRFKVEERRITVMD